MLPISFSNVYANLITSYVTYIITCVFLFLHRFNSGLELASSVANSDILHLSWSSITSLYSANQQQQPQHHDQQQSASSNSNLSPRFQIYKLNNNTTVLAFITSPVYSLRHHLQQQGAGGGGSELLVSSDELRKQNFPHLDFLCSKVNPSFSLHNAAVTCFASLFNDLSDLTSQLIVSKPNEVTLKSTLIVTGHSLGGSIASLFTLWLLDRMSSKKPSKKLPLCITFGSPLIGDKALQRAISQRSTWNSCFLHVSAASSYSPTILLLPLIATSHFGTFMFCSEDGQSCDCVDDPEIVSILLLRSVNMGSNEGYSVDGYGKMVENLKSRVICRGSSGLGGGSVIEDSLQAGIALQLQSIWISPDQSATVQSRKIHETKVKMAYFEWYKKDSKNRGIGYYDSYKSQSTIADMEIAKHKKFLTNYWKDLVEDAESRPQKEGSFFRTTFLYGGTNYRRMAEPLDIAEFYREGKRGYRIQGRSKHYVLLEKWQKDDAAEKKARDQDKKKKRGPGDNMNEDSCFWADVEEALIWVRLVKKNDGSSSEEAKKCLVEFLRYVMEQIEKYEVDSEIFLVQSSFMIWWKEFQEVMGIVVGDGNYPLVEYMKSGKYRYYGSE
ncbi:Senescence-associated carboxylesterase 101 [Linum perenne]